VVLFICTYFVVPEKRNVERIATEIYYEVTKVIKSKTTSHSRNVFSQIEDTGSYLLLDGFNIQ
jgi:hypothetical protein